MIYVNNLVKQIGEQTVLKGIDLEFVRGEFVAVVGGSGSGKSTLFQCLALKTKWDEGSYMYQGKDLLKLNVWEKYQVTKHWAYLQQHPPLNPRKTAFKNVLAGRLHHLPWWRILLGKPGTDEHVLVMDYLEKVGLMHLAERPLEKLSGGEKQRVAIAKATIQEAKLILADEPLTGLDPHSAEQVVKDLHQLNRQQQTTVICIMRQIEWAEKYADRILGLSGGEIVFDVRGRRLTQQEKNMLN